MVNKENAEKETVDKKRRKATNPDNLSLKQSKEDVYENVIANEEQEALRRSAEKDMALFHHTCNELKKLFEEIAVLKKDGSEKAKQEVHEKRIQGSLVFVALKKLNRLDKVRLRAGRDALHKEKHRVDSNRLQLQNLLYEANHLKREVQRCYQFKSQDEEIDLVSEDEFYASAPANISRPEKTVTDDHARRLARLEWELHQRKELSVLCKELTVSKESASKEICSKTERLNSLAPCLESLLKATRPLQTALELEIEKEWEVHSCAQLLPRPLYLVYVNLSAYADACDKNISTSIEGDEEEAKQLENEEKLDLQEDDDNQESDNEDNEAENRKKHHKRISKLDSIDIRKNILLKPHPLSVKFAMKNNSANVSISVSFYFFPALGFVTVRPYTNVDNVGIAANNVISPDNILNCLYPDDFGEISPNPKTQYQLSEYSMNQVQLMSIFEKGDHGKPYKWAQKLCGLEFVSPNDFNLMNEGHKINHELSQTSVPDVIKLIKKRFQSRLSLFRQIYALENKNTDFSMDVGESPSIRISSSLVQWSSIMWEEYSSAPTTQRFIDENLVSVNDLFYRAVIIRGSAKLECLISISSNFPHQIPLWSLCLSWNGTHHAMSNASIREMEFWTNSLENTKSSCSILPAQLRRTMSSLDIFLETEGPLYSPAEFTQDKTFFKSFRGRTRSRPYKIFTNGKSVIFKQI